MAEKKKRQEFEIDFDALQEIFESISDISRSTARLIDGVKRLKKSSSDGKKQDKEQEEE